MNFGGIQKCSTIDFPGKLCCVLFTVGCSLNCFYCHNRALLSCSGPLLSYAEVEHFLLKRQGLLDGVVLSGGEPCLQSDLADFLHHLHELGYRTKLDTNGQHPEVLHSLLNAKLLDYVAVDYKAPANDYSWVCGRADSAELTQDSLSLLAADGVSFEARTTLYPGLSADALLDMARTLPPLPRYRLNFFRMPELRRPQDALLFKRAALSKADIDAMLPQLQEHQPHIIY